MSEQGLQGLIEQADEILMQKIIDQQEGILGVKESHELAGNELGPQDLSHWHEELDKLVSGQKRVAELRPVPVIRPHKKLFRALLLISIILFILIMSSHAFRIKFLNWTGTLTDIYMEFRAGGSFKDTVNGWSQVFIPTKVPEGYQISDAASTKSSMFIEYSDAEGHRVTYYQYAASAVVRIDTEAANEVINWRDGLAYVFVKEGASTTISWNSGDYSFSIEYDPNHLYRNDIEEMAVSLQWKA